MRKTATMRFIGTDSWGRAVYKCLENGQLYKDINLKGKKDLNDCDNDFDGEPGFQIPETWDVVYVEYKKSDLIPKESDYEIDETFEAQRAKAKEKARADYILRTGHTPEQDGIIIMTKVD